MAKQRGIHQIKGKINNLCYYEQKYVRGGLIRRINEAMSERLKTDPVFANTRHANTIFGGCSIVAKSLLSFFGSRNTFLFKPYRQALLTSQIRKYFLSDNMVDNYPDILVKHKSTIFLPQVINSIVKNPISNSFPELDKVVGQLSLDDTYVFTFSYESLVRFCQKYNCIGVQLSITRPHYIYQTQYNPELGSYEAAENNAGGRNSLFNWYLSDEPEDIEMSVLTGTVDDALTFWIVYAKPILSIYSGRPILGETGASCGMITFLAS